MERFDLTANRSSSANFNDHAIQFEGVQIDPQYQYFQQPKARNTRMQNNTAYYARVWGIPLTFVALVSINKITEVQQDNTSNSLNYTQPKLQSNDPSVPESTNETPESIRGNQLNDTIVSKSTKERLETIRQNLGLSLSALADILGIERSTLYRWLDGESNLQPAKRVVLERLEKRSQMWSELSQHPPGVFMRSREYESKTLEGWLQDAEISDEILKKYMFDIATRVHAQAVRLSRAKTPSIPLVTPILDRLSKQNDLES
jgi:transcriptional regulator with XRE-family HTH domain